MILDIVSNHINCECDDSSTSSTVLVDRTSKGEQSTLTKSVRFHEASNVEHANENACQEDYEDSWYSQADYRRFKATSMYMAREIAKLENRNRAPFSYHRVLLRTYEACCSVHEETNASVLTSFERKHLERWTEVATSRLGLERWTVRSIQSDKLLRRNEIYRIVMELQNIVTQNPEPKADFLRQSSERISRPSRVFARTLAEAHAAAHIKQQQVLYEL
jgi:hypothetical protein